MVQQGLAACATIVPGVRSIYRWQGRVETGKELLLIIKTTRRSYQALENAVWKLHPYEVPEIIGFYAATGLPQYLEWVDRESHNKL